MIRLGIIGLTLMVLAGCNPLQKGTDSLTQYRDEANGVICYMFPGDHRSMSCVKVKP